jgi:hypothetical protein
MRARFFNRFTHGRLAWLLGILLLMPLAQTVATWHLVSHIQVQASETSDESGAALADYCDLCQTAMATTGGLLPTLAIPPIANAAAYTAPVFAFKPAVVTPHWPPYASRAPPFSLN